MSLRRECVASSRPVPISIMIHRNDRYNCGIKPFKDDEILTTVGKNIK